MLWRLLFIALIAGAQCMMSDRCPESAGDLINTTNSITSQSSDFTHNSVDYSSGRATDGNTTVCAHTNKEQKPWWRIDLLGVYNIYCVSIYNDAGDHTNVNGAQIHVGNSLDNSGTNNKMCANITPFKVGEWNDFTCTERVSGRYVTVSFPGTKTLILCEVKIYGNKTDLINTANSTTSQSSDLTTDFPFNSGRAADGNKTQCASTKSGQGDHWWRIDLLGVYNISFVSIYNKMEHNTNMTGAQIHVGNSRENNGTNNKMCANITHFEVGQWNDFKCAERVSGRYVTVFLPQQIGLILCEVEIYGKKKDLINTANSITSQSSDFTPDSFYHSVKATDGDKTQCASTKSGQGDHWWRIDLLGVYNISFVSIYNKIEHISNMTGAQIHVGNSRENSGTNNKMCARTTNFNKEQWNDFTCTERVSGRYVTVSFPGTRPLILCEVKIYGKKKDLINTTNSITSQSSNYTDEIKVSYSSGRATDGVETVCANTMEEQKPWWRIDLLGVYNISFVSIYNKNTHNTDITNAQIHVGNSRENNGTNNKICANITNFNKEQWNNYTCTEGVSGRYVTVFFPGTKALILCEVEIYGKKRVSPFELIQENKTWEHALQHCRDNNMDLATILNEDDQVLAELEAQRADTPFLWLGLHYTCILEVWFWVADYRLEFNRWADGEKTGDCDRSAVMSRAEGHQWFSKSDYDEFNFICQKF
ncbi:uncharacterized protein LOC119011485 [Acanthopagrus latus]|uniref:uncharacterized protein LOC119011485 n=1 Tax=Acanthopagrus latus TaxID=8177 RepID=UPI00187CC4A5|nr:uncharacterized protein LOC119011485 [Acanthopagrus latus]